MRNAPWTFHETDWNQHPIAASGTPRGGAPPAGRAAGAESGAPQTPPPRPVHFGFMYVMDVNGDGRRDVVTGMGHDYGVCWYEQNADGSWTQRVIDNTWSQAHAPTLADVNGDGQLDLVAGKRYFAHNGSDPGEREPIGLYLVRVPASGRRNGEPCGRTRQCASDGVDPPHYRLRRSHGRRDADRRQGHGRRRRPRRRQRWQGRPVRSREPDEIAAAGGGTVGIRDSGLGVRDSGFGVRGWINIAVTIFRICGSRAKLRK